MQCPGLGILILVCLDVVAVHHFLIADVELPVGDHRVCPGTAVSSDRLLELALLDVLLRIGFDQPQAARSFVAEVESSVGIRDRPLARSASSQAILPVLKSMQRSEPPPSP